MLAIFEAILPIFLLVLLGIGLKRAPVFEQPFWDGLEKFGYYVLFPSLLFMSLSQADFARMATGSVTAVTFSSVVLMSVLVLASWPLFRRSGVSPSSFTTIFQTATRWNAFMALAIAEKLAGANGLTVIAIIMAANILPINVFNIGTLVWFNGGSRNPTAILKRMATNPIILGAGAGVLVNLTGIELYDPVLVAVDLVSRSALGLGLIMVGAGLKISDALKPHPAAIAGVVLKLLVFPMIMTGIGLLLGVQGETLLLLALSGGVPTAMNGYLLAKQMGGDAPLYAAIATLQTAAAFFTIPAILWAVGQVAGG